MKDWISKIQAELERASKKFGKFNTTHEGYAVILEELDELWDGIKGNHPMEKLEIEAIQVAAMALRFLVDCCEQDDHIDGPLPSVQIEYVNHGNVFRTGNWFTFHCGNCKHQVWGNVDKCEKCGAILQQKNG